MKIPKLVLALLLPATASLALAAEPAAPASDAHGHHCERIDERGDQGMGFSHELTGHHFYLSPAGGTIAVAANHPDDTASRDAVRSHLQAIAEMFRQGNFSIPMFVHDTVPPGVEEMKALRDQISYFATETENGAQVVIRTENPRALEAIHKFLRFQIEEHRTGDPLEARK